MLLLGPGGSRAGFRHCSAFIGAAALLKEWRAKKEARRKEDQRSRALELPTVQSGHSRDLASLGPRFAAGDGMDLKIRSSHCSGDLAINVLVCSTVRSWTLPLAAVFLSPCPTSFSSFVCLMVVGALGHSRKRPRRCRIQSRSYHTLYIVWSVVAALPLWRCKFVSPQPYFEALNALDDVNSCCYIYNRCRC